MVKILLAFGAGLRLCGEMTLRDYLEAEQLSATAFGQRIGVSHQTVYRYLKGDRIPDRRTMQRIALATGCRVTANDFFGIGEAAA